jgi:hypothetical protein
MLKAGTDLFTVSWEMRHADIRTTSITYLEPDEELGRNGVKALDQMVGFLPPADTRTFLQRGAAPLSLSRRPGTPERVPSRKVEGAVSYTGEASMTWS